MIRKFTKTQFRTFFAAILFSIAFCGRSYAGGFPTRPHSLLLSPSVSYFYANKGWDSLRKLTPYPNNGHFSSVTYSLYAEYGISKRFTFVALLPYANNTYEQTNYKNSASGLTDLETGIKWYVANIGYKYYFSIQGTLITPLYTNPSLGYGQTGGEIKLSFAGTGHLFGLNSYFNLDNAFRQYFDSTGPFQDRYNGTYGLALDKKFQNQIAISLGGFYSTSSFTKFSPIQFTNKDFSFNQVSLSYGHTFSKEFSIYITGSKFINGRNTGDGTSGSFSLIIRPF